MPNYFVNTGTVKEASIEYEKEFTSKSGTKWDSDIVVDLVVDVEGLDFDVDLSIKGSYRKDDDDIVTSKSTAFKPIQAVKACGIDLEWENVDGEMVKDFKNEKVHFSQAGFPKNTAEDMVGARISYISYKTPHTNKNGKDVFFKHDYITSANNTNNLEKNFNDSVSKGFVKHYVGD